MNFARKLEIKNKILMTILIPLAIVVFLLCLAVEVRESIPTNKFLEEHNQTQGIVIDRNEFPYCVYPLEYYNIYYIKILFQDEDVRYIVDYNVNRDDYYNTNIGDVIDVKDYWTIEDFELVKSE